jgi:[acyl-carrier-protein] S-malonyltransferase
VAAGALELRQCLELVALRARLMDRDAAANPGAMSAVMGLSPEEVARLCEDAGGVVQPANYNSPQQTVITGEAQAVAAAGKLAKERGAKAIPLKVSGAWHSPLMAAAGEEMAQALAAVEFSAPRCPHFPNTTGEPATDPAAIKAELQRQLTSPVRWVQSLEGMAGLGAELFIECGPKNVLAGLVKKTLSGVEVLGVEDPAGAGTALARAG